MKYQHVPPPTLDNYDIIYCLNLALFITDSDFLLTSNYQTKKSCCSEKIELDGYLQKANENKPRAPFIGTTCFYIIIHVTLQIWQS